MGDKVYPNSWYTVPYERDWEESMVSGQDPNVDFFQGLVVKKQSISDRGYFSVSCETGKVHFCTHHHK